MYLHSPSTIPRLYDNSRPDSSSFTDHNSSSFIVTILHRMQNESVLIPVSDNNDGSVIDCHSCNTIGLGKQVLPCCIFTYRPQFIPFDCDNSRPDLSSFTDHNSSSLIVTILHRMRNESVLIPVSDDNDGSVIDCRSCNTIGLGKQFLS